LLDGPTEGKGEEREGLTGEEDDDGSSAKLDSGEGGGWWLRPVRGRKELGRAFYRRSGAKGAVELPDSGELPGATINGAQRRRGDATAGRYWRGRWSRGGGRSGAKLPCVAGWQRGGGRRRWPEVTAAKRRRKDDEAADKRGYSARGSEHAREREQLTGGVALPERGRRGAKRAGARAEAGRRWAAGGGARARERGEAAGLGRESAQQGRGGFFFFFFLFSNPYFPFCIFFFCTNYFVGNLGVEKK
jgi:hypothetical protein